MLVISTAEATLYYPRQLKGTFETMGKLPAFRKLVVQVEKGGSVRIELKRLGNDSFEGYWEGDRRVVTVNQSLNQDRGVLICTIIFELHNALRNQELYDLALAAAQGKLDKDTYVRKVEEMEYRNVCSTIVLLEEGVRLGLFPKSAQWKISPTFEDHYRVQQLTGHSQWIANSYDDLNINTSMPYRGTIPNLYQMTPEDKREMLRYLNIKSNLYANNPHHVERARHILESEWRRGGAHRTGMLRAVFAGTPAFDALVAKAD